MGLIGGIAKTAIASGTWTAVSNRVSRRQANRWADQDQQQYYQQQPATGPVSNPTDDRITRLKQLGELKTNGVLTDEEFAAEKAKILAG